MLYIFLKFLLKYNIHSEKFICCNAQFDELLQTEWVYITNTQVQKQYDQSLRPPSSDDSPKDNHNLAF